MSPLMPDSTPPWDSNLRDRGLGLGLVSGWHKGKWVVLICGIAYHQSIQSKKSCCFTDENPSIYLLALFCTTFFCIFIQLSTWHGLGLEVWGLNYKSASCHSARACGQSNLAWTNPPVLSWRWHITQAVLQNGYKTVALVVTLNIL